MPRWPCWHKIEYSQMGLWPGDDHFGKRYDYSTMGGGIVTSAVGHHNGLGQLRQEDQRQGDRDRAADAGSDLREGHQLQSIGGRQDRNIASAALAAVAGGHDRRIDRVHAQQPPDEKPGCYHRRDVKTNRYKVASGIVWDRSDFVESLTSACAAICYARLREEQRKARAAGRLVGIGIATYAELTGIGSRISAAPGMPINTSTEAATIRLDSTGAVIGSFGIASHGQGLETTLAQVVADELGARIEDIRILHGDSAVVAHGTGTYASRSAVLAGGAATLAARLLKEKVIRAASYLIEASVEDIEAVDGRVFVTGTDRSLTFREIAKAVYSEMGRLPRDAREELEVTKVYDPYFGTTTSATHIVVLEIDPETCKVELDRYVVAEDCGQMINPMIVDGQVHGAVAQGIGAALYEEVIYDATGQLLTASLADYAIPTASAMPSIATVHLEAESPSTVGGFRGMGEGGAIGAPAAIANALADARAPLGAEIFELPMTPERLFRLIEKV